MRILEISHYMPPHPGGIERVVSGLADGLARRGHEVRWIASATPARPGRDGPRFRVPAWNLLERRFGAPYPLWSPAAFATLRDQVRWADAVHAHDCLYVGSILAARACRRYAKPLLITQHVGFVPMNGPLNVAQRIAYSTFGRRVLEGADRLVSPSPHVPDWFRSIGVRAPFRCIPYGIDDGLFRAPADFERRAARRDLGIPADAKVVLFVGRLVPKKGIPAVAEAQRTLASEGVRLVIAGDGPLSDRIRDLPGALHLRSVPAPEMARLYAMADAFLLPSRGEGLPLSVQEAMMSGLCAVVSDDPSFRVNLTEAPGIAVCSTADEMAAALRRFLSRPVPPETISSWSRRRWGMDRFLSEYESVLDELVRRRESPNP